MISFYSMIPYSQFQAVTNNAAELAVFSMPFIDLDVMHALIYQPHPGDCYLRWLAPDGAQTPVIAGDPVYYQGWHSLNNMQIPAGDFCWHLVSVDAGNVIRFITPISWRKVYDRRNYAILRYRNPINAFGFPWSSFPAAEFRLRIPALPRFYNPFSEDEVFTKSNGEEVILNSQTFQEWTLDIEMMPQSAHEALALAIRHKTTLLNDFSFDQGYEDNVFRTAVFRGNYEIEWLKNSPDFKIGKATAKFRVSPYEAINLF